MFLNIDFKKMPPSLAGILCRLKYRLKTKRVFGGPRIEFPFERSRPVPSNLEIKKLKYSNEQNENFVLYRIIGNDLPPRHRTGQALENLKFILEHEVDFPNCEKRFVVNRIVNAEVENSILEVLNNSGYQYLHIPFEYDKYRENVLDITGVPAEFAPYSRKYSRLSRAEKSRLQMRLLRYKNNYVMNNNGARNTALQEGKKLAKWVLPWDGNCFITPNAWEEIVNDIISHSDKLYFLVPMARMTSNFSLLEENFRPIAEEEPQLIFRHDSGEEFDANFFYGRRPKVELFWRLGIPGAWDCWPIEPWDLPCPEYSKDAGKYASAGWVARLFSGQTELENKDTALIDRGVARNNAIESLLVELDKGGLSEGEFLERLVFINFSELNDPDKGYKGLLQILQGAADAAMQRGPYSVIDKKTLPPSKNAHDYWHPSPYFWPNPITRLPYIRRDGKRVPGTRLYEPMSDNYDRTRLQRLFDDTFVLTLAGSVSQDEQYDDHAAKLVRTWFLNPETAMAPHLDYAQVRKGWNKNRGSSSGIIEAKDFYYFLDAVRLLEQRSKLTQSESNAFREWLSKYLHWLRISPQGVKERAAQNNHGTYYDLQVGAIAAFLGEDTLLRHTLRDCRFRIVQQFATDGSQPEELKRTTTAHYCCFNLQGWVHLAQLAESCGEDLWSFEGPQGQSIRRAMEWLLPYMDKEWPFQQIVEFDSERFYPIYYSYLSRYGKMNGLEHLEVPRQEEVKPLFFPHDGIRPFWQLN
ncbi:alginate lyase family protein [Halomonas sp. A29]|uniref:alginate lyase family protein n=1 Tax=Halomonas sp. A29 TaxID=3102786 RepID=UPI00398AC0DD